MTISAPSALKRLGEVAQRVGAQSVLWRLGAVSLPTDTKNFVGILVWYLAQRERIGFLTEWAPENLVAAELEPLARAAWVNAELRGELRAVGDEHLARRVLYSHTGSHYLAAMAAARRAHTSDCKAASFVERLRLLLLIRAIEAADEGILRESNLAEVCATVRKLSDETGHNNWAWVARLAHPTSGFDDFVSETRFQSQKGLETAVSGSGDRTFYLRLQALLNGEFKAIRDKSDNYSTGSHPNLELSRGRGRIPTHLFPVTRSHAAVAERILHIDGDTDESCTFAVAEIDASRPAPAQREQGTGLVLQSLEETQYLRHSWHRLTQEEEAAFVSRASRLAQADQSATDRLGAALTAVATLTSTPLSSLGLMRVGRGLTDDWSLDLREGTLRRKPPRFPRRWRAIEERATAWVQPLATEWRVDLSPWIKSALCENAGSGVTSTVDALWTKVSPTEPLHIWFGRCFTNTEYLARLTAPVVSTVLGQQTFDETGDHALARLVGSRTRTGLPSACTYGSYAASEVHTALDKTILAEFAGLTEPTAGSVVNATGSELDVHMDRMAEVIRRMTRRVNDSGRHPGQWADHHNRLTALCVIALLASTGARPVSSPFESLSWFDVKRGLVYVEDKHTGPTRGARLCVLSDIARDLLCNHYLPHLEALARALERVAPAMTVEIRKILARESECQLPLFFFLRAEGGLDWIEVSESQLAAVCSDPWPLPWNVFRHLHATRLRRWGLDPEIRDALLSHGDRGAESHGESSWRVPQHDLEIARPLIERLCNELGFVLPSKCAPIVLSSLLADGLDFTTSKPFGRKARALRRETNAQLARQIARREIEKLVDGPPSSLSQQKWDEIAQAMLLRRNGLPHSMASLRYEVLEDYLAELWRDKGVHVDRPPVRVIPIREGASIFSEDVIGAAAHLNEFRQRLDLLLEKEGVRALRRPVLAGCLAALELVLHCRVSHFAVLAGVACNSAAIRVVRFTGRYWLEWAYRAAWQDGRPNYRVPITERAAGWIGASQEARKQCDEVPPTPDALRDLVGNEPQAFGVCLKRLASLTGQVNNFELPGAMAAALSGARETAALPHSDWVRTTLREALRHTPTAQEDDPPVAIDPVAPGAEGYLFRNHHRAVSAQQDDALLRCKTLFDTIQQILSRKKVPVSRPRVVRAENESGVTPTRRSADIARAVQASGFGRGDAPFVMAHYATYLLKRPKQAGHSGTLKASTALRYWETLKPGFLDFAFDTHLPDLEEEELTLLYARIVRAAGARSDAQDSPSPGHARRRKVKQDTDGGHRAINELIEFHRFARDLYGLEDPDWSEIAPGKAVGHGRPGIVLMDEYMAALRALIPTDCADTLDDDSLAAAFALFACGRFGLRGGEAVGLQRCDWVQIATSIVVLVRSSRLRTLKNIGSKRQVPLVGTLTSLEQTLVDETLRRWEHREGVNRNSPLLPGVGSSGLTIQQRKISARLLPLLKSTTKSPATTIHHLRHGFACRLLALLCGRQVGTGLRHTREEYDGARRLLMTSNRAGRRTLWAVARGLGHASPAQTTMKAYVHVLDTWLPDPPPRASTIKNIAARTFVNLDELERDPSYLVLPPRVAVPSTRPETVWVRTLRYLRLLALGNANAAWLARLEAGHVNRVNVFLQEAASRLGVMPPKRRTLDGLLAGVRASRWTDLVGVASASDGVELQSTSECIVTVGANRQIVLFLPEHFRWAGQFVKALGITPADCRCVYDPGIHPDLKDAVTESGLAPFAIGKADYTRSFQLDRAVIGSPERAYKHRVSLVPAKSGLFADTVELLVMWVTWLCCSTAVARVDS